MLIGDEGEGFFWEDGEGRGLMEGGGVGRLLEAGIWQSVHDYFLDGSQQKEEHFSLAICRNPIPLCQFHSHIGMICDWLRGSAVPLCDPNTLRCLSWERGKHRNQDWWYWNATLYASDMEWNQNDLQRSKLILKLTSTTCRCACGACKLSTCLWLYETFLSQALELQTVRLKSLWVCYSPSKLCMLATHAGSCQLQGV